MNAFLISLGMIFLAELGDKTQLVAMTLATRFSVKVTLAGIFFATLAVHVFSAALGGLMGGLLPTDWIKFVAGLAFIGFGFWTLRGDSLDEEEGERKKSLSPFWLVFVTFFLAELGDKTMLSTVTLAATNPVIPVWIGSTIGMVLSDGLAILVGNILGSRLPERAIKIGAAVIFFAFGAFSLIRGGLNLPSWSWAIAVLSLAALSFLFFRRQPSAEEGREEVA